MTSTYDAGTFWQKCIIKTKELGPVGGAQLYVDPPLVTVADPEVPLTPVKDSQKKIATLQDGAAV